MCVQSRTSLADTTVLVEWGAAVPALFVAADAAPAALSTASETTVAATAIEAGEQPRFCCAIGEAPRGGQSQAVGGRPVIPASAELQVGTERGRQLPGDDIVPGRCRMLDGGGEVHPLGLAPVECFFITGEGQGL